MSAFSVVEWSMEDLKFTEIYPRELYRTHSTEIYKRHRKKNLAEKLFSSFRKNHRTLSLWTKRPVRYVKRATKHNT